VGDERHNGVLVNVAPASVVYASGPTMCVDVLVDGWLLLIEQPVAREKRFDVYLRHADGSRVPAGPNLHSDWEREAERLIGVLHKPLRDFTAEVSNG
jgi:hypothetical protein